MNNKRATKRALLTSVMALVMCVVMLVGTTFAWFTDTASTAVNKIQAGNLDITVEYAKEKMNDDGTLAGELTGWAPIDNATNVFDPNALWEPGRTEYVVFRITNNGNLALKYKLSLETLAQKPGINKAGKEFYLADYLCASAKVNVGPGEIGSGVSTLGAFMTKLNDLGVAGVQNVLDPEYHPLTDATVNGTLLPGKTNCVPMAIWMPTSVGNEANAIDDSEQHAATIDFGITVVATQYTHEFDSFNNQYDEDATYPVVDAADLAASVADLATAGNKNVVVSVAQDMNNIAGIKTAKGNTLTMDLNGKSVGVSYGQGSTNTTTNGMQLLQGSTVTLKNGTYKANHGNDPDHNIAILIQNYSNLTIENCTLDMREANDSAGNSSGTSYALSTNCGKVVIKGKTNIYARNNTEYALDVMHWENTGYEAEGTSVTFDETMTGIVDGKIDVYCYSDSGVVRPVVDGGATLTIMGGTFKNSGLTLEQFKAFVPAGYTVTTNADGSFTVSK